MKGITIPKAISMRSKMRMLIGLVLAASILVITTMVSSVLTLETSLHRYEEEAAERQQLLMNIRAKFGYGAAIHCFKNFVLRGDERCYQGFLGNSRGIHEATRRYRLIPGITPEESEALDRIDEVVTSYREHLAKARQMIDLGAPPMTIDQAVKVDDTAAVTALETIDTHYQRFVKTYRDALDESIHDAIYKGASGIVVAILLILLLFVVIRKGLSDNDQVLRQLRRSRAYNRKVIDSLGEGLYGVDTESRLTFLNPTAEQLLGWKEAELLGKCIHSVIHYQHPDGSAFPAEDCSLLNVLRTGETCESDNDVFMRKDGTAFPVEYISTPLYEDDEIVGSVMGFMDITKRKADEERIRRLAFYDDLTGLPNQHYLRAFVEQDLLLADRYGMRFALLYIDLDNFQLTNDTLGHNQGDELLKMMGERIGDSIREPDRLTRPGGDEFIVILFDPKQHDRSDQGVELNVADAAARVAERILKSLKQPFALNAKDIYLSASIGISQYPLDGEDFSTLLTHAGSATAHAKEQGRHGYALYSADLSRQREKMHELETALHKALEREEFVLYYQPIVELATGQIIGAEALIRWQSPERGLVPPDEFIPIAERGAIIEPIGEWVTATACRQVMAWRGMGYELHVAINLSVKEFRSADIAQRLTETLARENCPAACIDLEITEGAIALDETIMQQRLEELRASGMSLSLDDFGTGYSSLSRLKHLPVQTLKIDRSFIADVVNDERDRNIVISTIRLAHGLGMHCLAEGIEDQGQLTFLRDQGCRYGQGYYFSRPVPAEDFEQLLLKGLNMDDPS